MRSATSLGGRLHTAIYTLLRCDDGIMQHTALQPLPRRLIGDRCAENIRGTYLKQLACITQAAAHSISRVSRSNSFGDMYGATSKNNKIKFNIIKHLL